MVHDVGPGPWLTLLGEEDLIGSRVTGDGPSMEKPVENRVGGQGPDRVDQLAKGVQGVESWVRHGGVLPVVAADAHQKVPQFVVRAR